MKKLLALFPLVEHLFTEDKDLGISSSQATATKNENTNESNRALRSIEGPLYLNKREIYGEGIREHEESSIGELISPESIISVSKILVENNSTNAWIGHAVKYKASILQSVIKMQQDVLGDHFKLKMPKCPGKEPIQAKAIVNWGGVRSTAAQRITHFCNTNKAEDLLHMCSQELLDSLNPKMIKNMIVFEAKASAFGKRLHNDAFLRKLMNAPQQRKAEQIVAGNTYVITTPVLAYNKEDFLEVEKELQDKYNKAQMARNGTFKAIKDAARALQSKYNEEYTVALGEYTKLSQEYQNKLKEFNSQTESIRSELIREIAALKIL